MLIFMSILLGVIMAISSIVIVYPFVVYFNLKSHENRVTRIYEQLKNQLDIKHEIISELENKNKDVLKVIREYQTANIEIDLKKYNDIFNYHILSSKNEELISRCNIAEDKINCIKDYYNEVVCSYNRYKDNMVASYLVKSFSFDDAKLY